STRRARRLTAAFAPDRLIERTSRIVSLRVISPRVAWVATSRREAKGRSGDARSGATVRMTVLHVLEAIEGGVARHMVNLVRHVDAEHIVVVPPERVGGVTDNAALAAIGAAGAQVEHLDMRRSPASPRTLAAVPKVNRLIARAKPDVVHGHSA